MEGADTVQGMSAGVTTADETTAAPSGGRDIHYQSANTDCPPGYTSSPPPGHQSFAQHHPPPPQQIILDGDFLPANFRTQSYEIAKDAVRYVCRGECYGPAPSKAAIIMRSLVEDTLKDRATMMSQLVRTLDVRDREQLQLVRNIANNMFDDEHVNWSRIVTLHAFCGCLAKYCEQRNVPDCADDVANVLADFVVNRLGLWIVTHGGWVRKRSFFEKNSLVLFPYLFEVNRNQFIENYHKR